MFEVAALAAAKPHSSVSFTHAPALAVACEKGFAEHRPGCEAAQRRWASANSAGERHAALRDRPQPVLIPHPGTRADVPGDNLLLPSTGPTRHNLGMGRKDKGREICINCGQTFHKKLTSKELRCTKCRKAEKKAA